MGMSSSEGGAQTGVDFGGLHYLFRQLSGIGLVAALPDSGLELLDARRSFGADTASLHRLHDGLHLLYSVTLTVSVWASAELLGLSGFALTAPTALLVDCKFALS